MLLAAAMVLTAGMVQAITIDMVPVGNPGNAGEQSRLLKANDPNFYGSVAYNYQIGKCEINAGQYTEFLNAVIPGGPGSTTDPYGLYDVNLPVPGYGSPIIYHSDTRIFTASLPSEPANYITWYDAARFCNWLQSGDTENGAYTLNGHTDSTYVRDHVTRNAGATYVIPTENEWYKAAYYDPNKPGGAGYWLYPTKSNTPPSNSYPSTGTNNANYYNGTFTLNPMNTTPVGSFANSSSAYGTLDQGGNVWELTETADGLDNMSRVKRGGAFDQWNGGPDSSNRSSNYPTYGLGYGGFRVACVPEPGSLLLLVCGSIAGLIYWRRNRYLKKIFLSAFGLVLMFPMYAIRVVSLSTIVLSRVVSMTFLNDIQI